MKSQTGQAENTKERLLETAEKLFADKGYDGVKLDDDFIVFEPTQIKSISNGQEGDMPVPYKKNKIRKGKGDLETIFKKVKA